jgi:para-nitrobenzyl esterase
LFGSPGVVWFPTLDGAEIPKVPTDAFQSGDAPQVPVILGTNKDEFALFTYAWKLVFGHDMTPQEGLDALGFLFTPQQVQSITTQFPPSSFPTTTAWANVVFTDGLFVCPTRKAVRALSAHGNPTYLYQFSYPFNPPVYPNVGAAHSFELPFVFGTNLGGRTIGDEERPTSQAMMGYWTRFAATGDPNGGGAPTWPRYDATSDTHIVLDATIGMGSGLHRDACDFWDKL